MTDDIRAKLADLFEKIKEREAAAERQYHLAIMDDDTAYHSGQKEAFHDAATWLEALLTHN